MPYGYAPVRRTGDTMSGDLVFTPAKLIYNITGYTGGGAGAAGGSTKVGVNTEEVLFPVQQATASAPTYYAGGVYYDTTLNKLRIGGAAGWETVTSS